MSETVEMRPALLDSPKVRRMARVLRDSPEFKAWKTLDGAVDELMTRAMVGTLVRVWAAARALAPTGHFSAAGVGEIDRIAGIPGVGAAMLAVGWLRLGVDCVILPNFGEYNPPPGEKPKRKRPERKAAEADARFDAFWAAYPRKIGKGAARASWARAKPDKDLAAAIVAAVLAQRKTEQWLKDGGQFIPHPATWLNQRRWEDEGVEPLTAKPAGPSREERIEEQRRRVRQLEEDRKRAREQRDEPGG